MVNENKALYWVWLTQCFSVSSPKVIELLDKTDPETFYKEKTAYSFLNHSFSRTGADDPRPLSETGCAGDYDGG